MVPSNTYKSIIQKTNNQESIHQSIINHQSSIKKRTIMKHLIIGSRRPHKTERPLKSSIGLFTIMLLLSTGSTRPQSNQEDLMHHREEVTEALMLISRYMGNGIEKINYLSEFDIALEKIYQP